MCGRNVKQDTYVTESGEKITFSFFGHASLGIKYEGCMIYIDPVTEYIGNPKKLPKADAILITHSHEDHFDAEAIKALMGAETVIYCDSTTSTLMPEGTTMIVRPNDTFNVDGIDVTTVAAYNTTDGHLDYHPRLRKDVGYVLSMGGSNVYVAGDTEPTVEMKHLHNIDVAFLPVNQPYTMTEEQASTALHELRPRVFYPYHYGQTESRTDLDKLRSLIADTDIDMRVEPME